MNISVRESTASDIEHIVDYFVNADALFLKGMGADKALLPERAHWIQKLQVEFSKPYEEKNYLYFIWMLDGKAIGHSNVNNIKFGESATMHLHLWERVKRKSGLGFQFIQLTIPHYFEKLQLKKIICEPYAENTAPNKTLKKLGFEFVRAYETIPGPISFQQVVNRYELKKEEAPNYK